MDLSIVMDDPDFSEAEKHEAVQDSVNAELRNHSVYDGEDGDLVEVDRDTEIYMSEIMVDVLTKRYELS